MVFVQADCRDDQALDEAVWIQEASDHGLPIFAAVAHAPLESDCLDHLMVLTDLPIVSGVRRLLQGEPEGFALQPAFIAGVRLLERFEFSMDLCIRAPQLAEATQLVRDCPNVRFVLDHVGKPRVEADAFAAWAADLGALAALPNVWCKLSGLATEAGPAMRTSTALRPWLAHALEVFGPERCMFGSDWPLLTEVSSYEGWVEAVDAVLDGDDGARESVFGGTARRVYTPN